MLLNHHYTVHTLTRMPMMRDGALCIRTCHIPCLPGRASCLFLLYSTAERKREREKDGRVGEGASSCHQFAVFFFFFFFFFFFAVALSWPPALADDFFLAPASSLPNSIEISPIPSAFSSLSDTFFFFFFFFLPDPVDLPAASLLPPPPSAWLFFFLTLPFFFFLTLTFLGGGTYLRAATASSGRGSATQVRRHEALAQALQEAARPLRCVAPEHGRRRSFARRAPCGWLGKRLWQLWRNAMEQPCSYALLMPLVVHTAVVLRLLLLIGAL